MFSTRSVILVTSLLTLTACAASIVEQEVEQQVEPDAEPGHAIRWAAHSAEYQALSLQIYAQATRDLPQLIANESWSAIPGHEGASGKPPAIILDVDETVVSGVDMELTMETFTTVRQYEWGLTHQTIPIRGVAEFVNAAEDLGVEVFFVTNRPCESRSDTTDRCIQEQSVVDLVAEIGIETDRKHVLMNLERPEWNKEKLSRRLHIAESHRVIMLFGDDYGDFVACSRAKPGAPCATVATQKSRSEALDTYKDYWGNGWYILPNPIYGSWTSVK
jgi:5'-nucleotidase (lipoprotein e(P4) family)